MLKQTACMLATIIGISVGVSSTVFANSSPVPAKRKAEVYDVKGIQAEFLFDAMSSFESVPGLEGTSDCAMGTCATTMQEVTCVKIAGPVASLTCRMKPVDGRPGYITVSYRDVDDVGRLRRALIDIAGGLTPIGVVEGNSVRVTSIQCTARSLSRDLDSLETEQTYECKITR